MDTWSIPWTGWSEPVVPCNKHEWLDSGSRMTYCKKCDVRGRLDPMTGAVEILPEREKEE